MAEVTVSELAAALESFRLDGIDVTGKRISVEVADADELAESLHATLSRMAALREPEPSAPIVLRRRDAELSAISYILAALEDLDAGAIGRVLDYVCSRKDCER
jgi:hypothetical protein